MLVFTQRKKNLMYFEILVIPDINNINNLLKTHSLLKWNKLKWQFIANVLKQLKKQYGSFFLHHKQVFLIPSLLNILLNILPHYDSVRYDHRV